MKTGSKILVTGGGGLLGGELKQLLPRASFPSSAEFDVTDYLQTKEHIEQHRPDCILHAAAFTSPPQIDKDPARAIEVNIIGTANIVKLCMAFGLRLVYISTDYVFRGDEGNYAENDPVFPVNKYAWSKLGGECAVRLYDKSLIVRTSFGPNVFPYPKAFADQWTSRESVRDIARKIVALFDHDDATGIIHLGGPRRTVLEFAKSQDPSQEVGAISIENVDFKVPRDTSLDCRKFRGLVDRD